jgi:ADP-ribose pyrophosphatase
VLKSRIPKAIPKDLPKIPPAARCVFSGVIYDIYQWQQPLFDGRVVTFECAKRPDTVVVLAMVGEKICYSVQEQPGKPAFMGLFGGRAEAGEPPLQAAQRELLEETGLTSDHWQLWRSYNHGSKLDWTVSYFIAKDCQQTAVPQLDGGEKISRHETSLEDFLQRVLPHPDFAERELQAELLSEISAARVAAFVKDLRGT